MKQRNLTMKVAAIAAGGILLAAGTAFAYWQTSRKQWCMNNLNHGSQEVVFTWGCIKPQRFRQWSLTASALNSTTLAPFPSYQYARKQTRIGTTDHG